ncbi:hypothetical protein FHX61_004709 [Cupriavidus alkaliphilus]|uniref:Uncharacterized protein n=1 Tax=Cupriavidus alkaliphilus TaxID=942866 RepID=A0A7W4YSV0_9BURK|nr:DUF2188 domain-containing protein [Cupriavidus alkaliphilus]MBB3010033.1 hypothetical protein [Cupriavidus alkaliphilus]
MPATSLSVVPIEQGRALEIGGTSEPRQLFPTLEAAISAGWARVRRDNIELHIQPLAGSVKLRAEDTNPADFVGIARECTFIRESPPMPAGCRPSGRRTTRAFHPALGNAGLAPAVRFPGPLGTPGPRGLFFRLHLNARCSYHTASAPPSIDALRPMLQKQPCRASRVPTEVPQRGEHHHLVPELSESLVTLPRLQLERLGLRAGRHRQERLVGRLSTEVPALPPARACLLQRVQRLDRLSGPVRWYFSPPGNWSARPNPFRAA